MNKKYGFNHAGNTLWSNMDPRHTPVDDIAVSKRRIELMHQVCLEKIKEAIREFESTSGCEMSDDVDYSYHIPDPNRSHSEE